MKQRIQAKAQRLKRMTKRSNFFLQNKWFKENTKKFYRQLRENKVEINNPPSITDVENFWGNIWEIKKTHNSGAEWIPNLQNLNMEVEIQTWSDITPEETIRAINKTSNWKAAGCDGIANFWMKTLTSLHEDLALSFNEILKSPDSCPKWLTEGITYLIPKSGETSNPKNYRPITCLPTMYKILTSIITDRTYTFLENNKLLPKEQKGCRRKSYGCKDQLLINKAILEETKSRKRNLSTAWVDYKKAFDSVPHTWILKSLEIYKICPTITRFIANNMEAWKTTLRLYHKNGMLTSRSIEINSGIFQGDSLSPLLFCIALAPLSTLLNNTSYGYQSQGGKLNHPFYMDDLKTFAKDEDEQIGLLHTVKQFSDDIGMELSIEKCAKATFKRGKMVNTKNIELDVNTVIKELEQESTYKYLGVNEGDGIQHSMMKEKIRKEYYHRVRMILKTELNSKNKFEAINTLAIPVVTFSFNIINWTTNDLKRLDTKTRKLFTMNKMHHPKADIDRLYLPRCEGGRGLIQLELSFKTTTIGLEMYMEKTTDPFLQIVKEHRGKTNVSSITKDAKRFRNELDIPNISSNENEASTIYARRVKSKAKEKGQQKLREKWEEKALHGKFPNRAKEADVDTVQTYKWLKAAGLKPETEGLLIAAQNQCLATRSYHHRVLKDGTNPLCRLCNKFEESVDHIVSGCPELAKSEYIHRHNKAAAYIHWHICQHYNIKTKDKWYEHEPETVSENDNITILWDMSIHTDREIKANRPDIIIKDKVEKTCMLIDMTVPSDKNISVKVVEKLSKYKDLEIEIERMWHMKTQMIPVVIGCLGTIKKGLETFTSKIPGNVKVVDLQKIALLGTAHILRKVLSIK